MCSSKVQHIMDEMISTEREYVRSLSYIIEQYFPEMERLDLPQDLRGKRSIIFGNVEKLWDFHTQYFLKDLESCAHCPLSISSCFLRHVSQRTGSLKTTRWSSDSNNEFNCHKQGFQRQLNTNGMTGFQNKDIIAGETQTKPLKHFRLG